MKTKLMLIVLATAAAAQATPAITTATPKAPIHLSQVKSVYHRIARKPSAPHGVSGNLRVVVSGPFLNHPDTAPGPH